MTQTVFVTNRSSTHVYDSAMKYGALRFVTSGNYPIFKTTRLQEEIIEALINSNEDDMLLFSGSAAIAGMCMSIWLELHKRVRVLLWDRTQDLYVLREFTKQDIRLKIEQTADANGRVLL